MRALTRLMIKLKHRALEAFADREKAHRLQARLETARERMSINEADTLRTAAPNAKCREFLSIDNGLLLESDEPPSALRIEFLYVNAAEIHSDNAC